MAATAAMTTQACGRPGVLEAARDDEERQGRADKNELRQEEDQIRHRPPHYDVGADRRQQLCHGNPQKAEHALRVEADDHGQHHQRRQRRHLPGVEFEARVLAVPASPRPGPPGSRARGCRWSPGPRPRQPSTPSQGQALKAPLMMRNSPTKEFNPGNPAGRQAEERQERRVDRRELGEPAVVRDFARVGALVDHADAQEEGRR